jgi:hypothetical protein
VARIALVDRRALMPLIRRGGEQGAVGYAEGAYDASHDDE